MGKIILPRIDNIQVVPIDVRHGQYVVGPYEDKLSGQTVGSFSPQLERFGSPFLARANRFKHLNTSHIVNNLGEYISEAFGNSVDFEGDGELTLGFASGLRINLGHESLIHWENNALLYEGIKVPTQLYTFS